MSINLFTMRKACAAYHGKTVADLTDDDTGADLFLAGVNNARKKAEREISFESSEILATLVVEPSDGGLLSDATIKPTGVFSGIKEIKSVMGQSLTDPTTFFPLTLRRPNQGFPRNVPRYPTDGDVAAYGGCSYLIIRGDTIYKFPDDGTGDDLTIYLEGYGWLNDYTDAMLEEGAATPDFIVEHGFEYLQWQTIIELNFKFQTFVFRQEGNPGPPTKERDAAWESLKLWNSYRIAPHVTDDR